VGISLGLFISALVKTSEMATSLVPLILIPQILFSGLVGVPAGTAKLVGLIMPATWAFDEMKRLSGLDTLREEGSEKEGTNEGRGLYKHIEDLNDKNISRARRDIENYKKTAEDNSADFEKKMNDYILKLRAGETGAVQPEAPKLGDAPTVPEAERIPDDLSNYVDFLHPWGNILLNPIVLLIMFFGLLTATIIALRSQDIG
nr:ABC transporter permease [Acidobacteriota bacterium]